MPFRTVGLVFFLLFFVAGARGARAGVALNEILFDPPGIDTGAEWVEIMNNGSESADIGGWQLYPDGSGYFFFPGGFVIKPGSLVLMRLRSSGTHTLNELFHSGADQNLGNTAGSVALFAPGKRGAETIRSFVQWGREKQTWESAASEAGLWERGTFVSVEDRAEGSSIGFVGSGTGVSAWSLFVSPSPGIYTPSTSQSSPPPPASSASDSPPPPSQPSPPPQSPSSQPSSSFPPPAPTPTDNSAPVSPRPSPALSPAPPPAAPPRVSMPPASVSSPPTLLIQPQASKATEKNILGIVSNKPPPENVVRKEKERKTFSEPSPSVSVRDDVQTPSEAIPEESESRPAAYASAASGRSRMPYAFLLGALALSLAGAFAFLAVKFALRNDSQS